MILQIATALAIGAYAVLSKDPQPKRLDAIPRRTGSCTLAARESEHGSCKVISACDTRATRSYQGRSG